MNIYKDKNKEYSANKLFKDLDLIWTNKQYKKIKNFPLLKAVIRNNICMLLTIIFLSILNCASEFGIMFFFNLFVKKFKEFIKYKEDNLLNTIIIYGCTFFVLKFLNIIISRQINFLQNFIGSQTGVQLNSLIYKKVLKSSLSMLYKPISKDMINKKREERKKIIKANNNIIEYDIIKEDEFRYSEGEIVNLVQVDSKKISDLMQFGQNLFIVPIQLATYVSYLFILLGMSFIYGFAFMLLGVLINYFIFRKYRLYNKNLLIAKDTRLSLLAEVFNSLKIIKLYGWDSEFMKRLFSIRESEMKIQRKIFNVSIISITYNNLMPIAGTVCSIGAYLYFNDNISIEDAFTVTLAFSLLKPPIRMINFVLNLLIDTFASSKRIEDYIGQEDLEEYSIANEEEYPNTSIIMNNCSFKWQYQNLSVEALLNELNNRNLTNKEIDMINKKNKRKSKCRSSLDSNKERNELLLTTMIDNNNNNDNHNHNHNTIPEINPNNKNKKKSSLNTQRNVLSNINLSINKGEVVAIIGKVGSGKSSLLNSIINEMILVNKDTSNVIVNGSVAYVSQNSWIENKTLKENVIFNSELNEDKYNKVIDLCELKTDIELLEGGDQTEIGEKGVNLSGGQKARVNLARSVYADKDIYLFDDPFAALDKQVKEKILNNLVFSYLKSKTRLLVTHSLDLLPNVDKIIYLKHGKIKFNGSYEKLKNLEIYNEIYSKELREQLESTNDENNVDNNNNLNEIKNNSTKEEKIYKKDKTLGTKIIAEEDKEQGKLNSKVYYSFYRLYGGFCIFFVIFTGKIIILNY